MGSSIQPGKTTAHEFHREITTLQIYLVNICDFKLSTRTWFDVFSNFDHIIVIEVKSCHRKVRLRMFWFFFDRDGIHLIIELNHTKTFWVFDLVSKDSRPFFFCFCPLQHCCQAIPMENIVPKNKGYMIVTDKVFPNDEGLGQAIRTWLLCIRERNAEFRTISKKLFKTRKILRS